MIGSPISSRAIGDMGLRQSPSEWGGPRPAGAGSRSEGAQRAFRGERSMKPQR